MSTYVIRALVLSILRKNAHLPLLVALTPPILLATALLSLPSMSGVVELLDFQNTSMVVVLDKPIFDNCHSAGIIEVNSLSPEFSTVALIANHTLFDVLSATISARPVNDLIDGNTFASLPEGLYSKLGRPVKLELRMQDGLTDEVQVKYVHRLVDAPIIISTRKVLPQVYICITDKHSILRDIFSYMEENFFVHICAWIAFLTASYIPLVYVASRMVVKRVSSEFRAFINLGLSPGRLVFCASLSMLVVTSLLTIFLYSLTIVILYTAYNFVSTIAPFVSPQPGIRGVFLAVLLSILCYPLFYISAKRSITLEE